jgi:5-methylcytosine-specific restriction enzyme subunit McrC
LTAQANSEYLCRHQREGVFRLKPDFVLSHSEKKCILDAKWKLLDTRESSETSKYGINQSDFYQMFAYGHKYLGGKGDLVLIYPKCKDFEQAIDVPFCFSETLKLWVVPCDLEEESVIWPEGLVMDFVAGVN